MEMMEILLVSGFAGAAAVALINGLKDLRLWYLNRRAKKEDHREEQEDMTEKIGREMESFKTEMSVMKKEISSLGAGQTIILYDRIKFLAKSYIQNGEVSFDDFEDLRKMHEVYQAGGGNGGLDDLMTKVRKLRFKV